MIKLLEPLLRSGFLRGSGNLMPAQARHFSKILVLGASLAAVSVQGETLLQYSMTGQPGSQPVTSPTTVAEGVFAGDLIRGPGLNAAGLARGMSADGWNNINSGTPDAERVDPTRENAIQSGDYFEFTFRVQPGYVGSLDGLVHSLRRSAVNAPMFFEWQYSFDGFTETAETIVPQGPVWSTLGWTESYFTYLGRNSSANGVADNYNYMVTDVPTQAEGNEMPVFDLSGISDLQNIPGGTTVTFRLYGWAGGGNTGTASSNTVALGRENPDQVGGPLLTGSVIVDPNLGDDLPLLIVSEMGETVPAAGIHFFPKGTEITVTAEPVTEGVDVRYAPIGWSGSGSVTGGEGNAVTFTINEASTVEWSWRREHRLLVSAEGEGSVEVTTAERRPLLGWNFSGYRVPPADRVPPEEGELLPNEISNMNGVPASTVAPDMIPSTFRRTPVYNEDTEEGLRQADLSAGGLSSSMWRHTPNLAAAMSRNKYYEFAVSPTPGNSISLDSLYFNYRYTATGPHSMALLYSFDDFQTFTIVETFRMQDQNSGTQVASRTILFREDPGLQDVTQEVVFRVYAWGGTGTGVGTLAFVNALGADVDDMVLYGGISTTQRVIDTASIWLSDADLFSVEAEPEGNGVFTGWSGSMFSNRADLHGLDMRQPLVMTAAFGADSNENGIPDDWEMTYFGNLESTGEGDPDNDGFTNLEEYLRGTDPTRAEELAAAGEVPLSIWENPQRDPQTPGVFIIRDFGNGFRGAWEGSNDSRSAEDPFHPDGIPVPSIDNVSFDGPRMVVREDSWPEAWNDATVEMVFSVGDNDGNSFYYRYQDELNWYRVAIAGEVSNAVTRPRFGISIQKRIDGEYFDLQPAVNPGSDPTDVDGYKRMRVRFTPVDGNILIVVSGWNPSINDWETASYGHREFTIPDELGFGRAGFGTWAQAGGGMEHDWNPVYEGTLFESFSVTQGEDVLFHEDWAAALEPDALPASWTNPFAGGDLAGTWIVTAHGTIAELTSQGTSTSGTAAQYSADGEGPTLLAGELASANYTLDFGLHPFDIGAIGFVFDYVDADNYGRVLFANTVPAPSGSIPSGVVVSRKTGGLWTNAFIGDTAFIYRPGQPLRVSLTRLGGAYTMAVHEVDNPENIRRWEWTDVTGPANGGRYGFTSWKSADSHFLSVEAYGALVQVGEGLAISGIEKVGESIVLTVENPSGTPYRVQRTLDLGSGEWETVATDETGETWEGPIPAGEDRVFWRITR